MVCLDKEFTVENNSSEEWRHGPLHFSFPCFWEVHSHFESLSFVVTCFSPLEASRIFILPSDVTHYNDMSFINGSFFICYGGSSLTLSMCKLTSFTFMDFSCILLLMLPFFSVLSSWSFIDASFLLFSLPDVSTVQILKLLDDSFNFIFSPIHDLSLSSSRFSGKCF